MEYYLYIILSLLALARYRLRNEYLEQQDLVGSRVFLFVEESSFVRSIYRIFIPELCNGAETGGGHPLLFAFPLLATILSILHN